ncbi:arylesterase [Cyclobacterium jeungdonense]|uniref:Arylesterase n=1 Tax=Cyclobacterium jeungdonense TaxID=708087 RepID=A0ABT8C3T4_9BACT|nr:arylesterase [Cyclobacterium jeungdonense]MDN3686961.1 arylesterase [Cyclobacterium jeungdonense]
MKLPFKYAPYVLAALTLLYSCNQKPQEDKQETQESAALEEKTAKKTILFFGNSLTAGYGIEEEEAFPALIQEKVDSLGLDYDVINAGLSGETTASGLSRLDWFLEEKPEIFILELGGNDGLRGISLAETEKNLRNIISGVQEKFPETKIVLAGMQIPPNMGQEYSENFRKMYADIAQTTSVSLIPFLLEGVAGDPDLNLPDGIHPTEEGHRMVAENVWPYLKPLLL